MRFLCIDTSGETAIAFVDGRDVLAGARDESARHHTESITPLVRRVLADAGVPEPLTSDALDAVAVGTGPAPFTGLRAGLVSARIIARAAGVPVYGASSLDVLARQALDRLPSDSEVVVASDAKRKEVYWARYRAKGPDDVEAIAGPDVAAPEKMLNALRSGDIDAELAMPEAFRPPALEGVGRIGLPELDAAVLARLVAARLSRGLTADDMGTEPLYLRRPDIQGQPRG